MYDFIDTTEVQKASSLPAEAVRFNGIWLDREVSGFRTLHVSGRELMECEITDDQIGAMDGTQYQYKRYPSRIITVTYQLIAESNIAFREAYNQLNALLDAEQAELLFNDETDKYFIATKASNSEVSPGVNHVTGDICFYCTDPLKYSAAEKTFQASLNDDGILEATIINNGTESVPITYEITHNHENGYIGIVSKHGAMQYGCVDEVDAETRQKSEVLLKYTEPEDYDAMTNGQGILASGDNFPKNGTWASWANINGRPWLGLQTPGSGSSWHGASKQVTLPVDSNKETGAVNFKASAKVWFEMSNANQTGLLEFVIGDTEGNHLASIHIVKANAGSDTCSAIFQVRNTEKGRAQYRPDSGSVTNASGGQMYIQKEGNLFTFGFGGKTYPVRVPEAAGAKARTITIFLGNYGTSANPVNYMLFGDISFRKDNVDYLYDVPNRYQDGDVLAIDGETTKIYLNGIPCIGDEVKGTKYFHAPPGETKVQFYYSDFCNPAPTVKVRIREAYL